MSGEVIFNTDKNRYEMEENGALVTADIRRQDGRIYIQFVEAAPELRGTGAAGRFMKAMMDKIRAEEKAKVIPFCGYAASWLQRHPEYADMMG